ncbi:MAG: ribonuclease III [bacterium]
MEINEDRKRELKELQFKLGYIFSNLSLLQTALTHSTYVNESQDKDINDNERLEFLGDSVLGFAISDFLLQKFPTYTEGMLSKLKAYIVSERHISQIAKDIDLGLYLYVGKGEEISGGRNKPSILTNTYEAVIGGIYLDGGLSMAKRAIMKTMKEKIMTMGKKMLVPDYKSMLQEYAQKNFGEIPSYEVVTETGQNHNPTFEVQVLIKNEVYAVAKAGSKKKAEQKAAYEVLKEKNII